MMHENEHPKALTLALLLDAHKYDADLEYATYLVIEEYLSSEPDEKKADLYAMVAEQLDPESSLTVKRQLLSRLLWDNENHWAARHG
jgi:hypothetical protein